MWHALHSPSLIKNYFIKKLLHRCFFPVDYTQHFKLSITFSLWSLPLTNGVSCFMKQRLSGCLGNHKQQDRKMTSESESEMPGKITSDWQWFYDTSGAHPTGERNGNFCDFTEVFYSSTNHCASC